MIVVVNSTVSLESDVLRNITQVSTFEIRVDGKYFCRVKDKNLADQIRLFLESLVKNNRGNEIGEILSLEDNPTRSQGLLKKLLDEFKDQHKK